METTKSRISIRATACLASICMALLVGSLARPAAQARFDRLRPAAQLRSDRCRAVASGPGDRSDEALNQDEHPEAAPAKSTESGEEATPKAAKTQADPLIALQRSGVLPKTARPNAALSEAELAALLKAVAKPLAVRATDVVVIKQAAAPVDRLRVLTVLVKLKVHAEDIASYRESLPEQMPPDADALPLWGRPYAAAAIDRGWWSGERALRPHDNATWAFVALLLQKMIPPAAEESHEARAHTAPTKASASEDTEETYTGLVLDARGMRVERQIGPRVLDEDGHVVYPDPKFLPEIDWLEDHGMADYEVDPASAHRAGDHPLTVKALNTSGPGHDDFVVSNAAAEQIRRAAHRSNFMQKWAVSILIDPK